MLILPGVVLLAGFHLAVNAYEQHPFELPTSRSSDSYEFQWPIRKVAIIGAGPGGLVSYREFVRAGFDVRLFERDSIPGGNWHYSEEAPMDTPIPNGNVAVADFEPSLPPKNVTFPYEEHYSGPEVDDLLRGHRAPKPVWASMNTNAPAPVQQITELPWPNDTPWERSHMDIQRYLRAFASYHNLNRNDDNPHVSYNTRVELVEKRFNEAGEREGWRLSLKRLERTGPHSAKAIWTQEDFDAVVIASGRFNAPNMPNIKGAEAWAKKFPGRLIHSRQYRRPEVFANQTVLVVGASASGGQISRELSQDARVTTSIRPFNASTQQGRLKSFYLKRLPKSVSIIGEIKEFLPPMDSISSSGIILNNGTKITGIDSVIFATGYRYSFPFLPEFHGSTDDKHPKPLVTDGSHIRGLYHDIFSIQEPTLGFINMNLGIHSFTLSEYLAVAIAKVWAGQARLPNTPDLWRWCEQHVRARGGYSKASQFPGTLREDALIRFLVGWLNDAAVKYGGRQLDGMNPALRSISTYWRKAYLGGGDSTPSHSTGTPALLPTEEESLHEDTSIYEDYW